ncbi:flippase [Halovenus salina]|uniref:Flippase n=1 Tax=Halovenus salina TaxID=1510225 RepID=A0ABD5VZW8_9EURY|nr:flippase [Halovenus salina]
MGLISRIGGDLKFETSSQILGVILGGSLTIILAQFLSPNDYGLLFLTISVLEVAKIFSRSGVGKSTSRYIADYKDTQPDQIPHILTTGLIYTIIAIASTCAIIIFGRSYISELLNQPKITSLLFIGTGFIAASTLFSFARLSLQGFENIKASSAIFLLNRTIRTILVSVFVYFGFNTLGALLGYILAALLSAICGLVYMYINYYNTIKSDTIDTKLRKKIGKYSLPLILSNAANSIDKRVDVFLIGLIIDPTAVAYYTISRQMIMFIQSPISSLTFTLAPTLKADIVKGNKDDAIELYNDALSIGLLLYIPAAAGLIVLAEPTIRMIFGSQYLDAVPILQILSLYAIFSSIVTLNGQCLDFLGRARDRAAIKGVTSMANAGLNIFLLPWIGVTGAALSTVLTYAVYAISITYIMSFEIKINFRWLFHYLLIVCLITAVMSAVIYPFVGYIQGIHHLIALTGLGILVWMTLALWTQLIHFELDYIRCNN